MPAPTPVGTADFDNAIQRYVSGEMRIMDAAKSIGIGVDRLKREMTTRGIAVRTIAEAQAFRFARGDNTPWKAKFIAAAKAGREKWVYSEANRERFRKLGLAAKVRNKGRKSSDATMDERATTHQLRLLKVSPAALKLEEWIKARGTKTVMEQAVGRYNIDIAIGRVAVEVHRYSYMPLGATRLRERERTRYICDRGWTLCYVWISARGFILNESAADYIVALSQETETDPSLIGEYRVIRGSGEFVTRGRFDGDKVT